MSLARQLAAIERDIVDLKARCVWLDDHVRRYCARCGRMLDARAANLRAHAASYCPTCSAELLPAPEIAP